MDLAPEQVRQLEGNQVHGVEFLPCLQLEDLVVVAEGVLLDLARDLEEEVDEFVEF